MYDDYAARDRLGLSGPAKVWPPIPTYHPDRQRSWSAVFLKNEGATGLVWILEVKGLGAIVLRSADAQGTDAAISTFTADEIGHAPGFL